MPVPRWWAAAATLALLTAGCGSAHRTASAPTTATSPTTAPSSRSAASTASTAATTAGPPNTAAAGLAVPLQPAWTARLDGAAVYASPVAALGKVFVATEDDNVYALNPSNGNVLWHKSIGTPLTSVAAQAGCGDIDPLGITSRPVVDAASGVLYVVGEVTAGGVHRELVGFDAATGAVVRTAETEPTGGGDEPVALQQRADLVLANGRVYVGFGGLFGDCGRYHGWVVGVGEKASTPTVEFDATPGNQGGAVWEPGGPSVDAAGNVFVTTGNRNNPSDPNVPYAESVVKLSPALAEQAFFTDQNARDDEDLATDSPTLLPDGTVFAVGKTGIGYLLRQSDLGLVARIPGVCGSDPDGANAYDPTTDSLYVPCRGGGIQQVLLARHALGWRAGDVNSTPVLAGGLLWALQYGSGALEALDPATGRVRQKLQAGSMPTFATPTVDGPLLTVGTNSGVRAFRSAGAALP